MTDAWLGFLGGILATLVGGFIASVFQRSYEKEQKKVQSQIDLYFLLVDLSNWYFWVTTAEFHNEEPDQQVLDNCRKISFQINDKIREFDEIEELDEILYIIFDERVSTARERATRLNELISKYGKLVNPKYSKIINKINEDNLLQHGSSTPPSINAPGSWRYKK